ncbi:MAG: spermidine synthase [Desulfobacterales bacterium RIFOXYA12_FULL_46_15]|nr:MAG: spermidine synthase [Desulfobacula sp. GWF2_41_7]OGR27182.1 MAG: spermidine synthase [Desulfobacterales bacterium RIFOXYA12_FULL_46_15]
MWPGMGFSLQIEQVLYSKRSKFQQIDVYQTRNHGKMLALDGIIQLTEFDEFAYQEMLAHVPLFAHPCPKTVLVIGGGDGGILREVCRHDCVTDIDFCEIDEDVIKVSKQFLPSLACGFDDPRIKVHIGDGCAFVLEKKSRYDVIIVDSSDPIGPGDVLFKKPFYKGLKAALKPDGIVATQGESIFLHQEWVIRLAKITKELFIKQGYSCIMIPTYPGGNIGICLGSLGPELTKPARPVSDGVQDRLKYYSPGIHEASFILPHFAKKMLRDI